MGKSEVPEEVGITGRMLLQFPHERQNLMGDALISIGNSPEYTNNLQGVI